MDGEKCLICDRNLNNYLGTKIVREKGLQALINASIKRNDGKAALFNTKTEIEIHEICTSSYTNEEEIERDSKKHDITNYCLICEELLCDAETIIVKHRGLQKLISVSIQRDDGKVAGFLNRNEIQLHDQCRNCYIGGKTIKAAIKRKLKLEEVPTKRGVDSNECTGSASCIQTATIKETATDTNPCIICKESLSNGQPHRTVKQRAINTYIKHSLQLQDGKAAVLKNKSQLKVHDKCARRYSDQKVVETFMNRKGPINEAEWLFPHLFIPSMSKPQDKSTDKDNHKRKKKKQQDIIPFYEKLNVRENPYENCLVCGKDASAEYLLTQTKRDLKRRVRVLNITERNRETLILHCQKYVSCSEEYRVLVARLENEDLLANKARFHEPCHRRATVGQLGGHKRSRRGCPPKNPTAILNMQHVYRYMESDPERYQFTVEELIDVFRHYELPAKDTFKYYLKQKYGKALVFTPFYFYFKNKSLGSLTESWYNVREENERLG